MLLTIAPGGPLQAVNAENTIEYFFNEDCVGVWVGVLYSAT
jgi:hypothetical protein